MSLLKKWFSNKELDKTSAEANIENVNGTVLRITLNNVHLATLYHDGSEFCIVYKKEFLDTGLSPFNVLGKNELVEPGKTYTSPFLWNAFISRLPSPNRDDYKELLTSFGLNGNEDPLLILSKVGRVSIAKPWTLELVDSNKAS